MSKTLVGNTILVGDDDLEVCNYLEMALRCRGYSVETAQDGEEVLASLQESKIPISAVLLDLMMPRKDGLETLREIRQFDSNLPVIMISGDPSPTVTSEIIKLGAADFLVKPLEHNDLNAAVKRALESRRLPAQEPLIKQPAVVDRQALFGINPEMREIQDLIDPVAVSEVPVLIQGETGAGKEVFAREIHRRSPRKDKPFLKLNCAALPPELVESELFGYERGAFTGAFQRKPGLFELADKGTLLLDEIGDMDLRLQAKLLQVLQDQEFQRIGGKEVIRVDVRIIAATHRDLETQVMRESFREDLYYRLNVISFRIPPLRERTQDIVPLAEFLLRRHLAPGAVPPVITPMLKQVLMAHRWPGNVRELENVVRKFLVLRDPNSIVRELQAKSARLAATVSRDHLKTQALSEPARDTSSVLDHVAKAKSLAESEAILTVLTSTCWNRKQAAALLNIDYKAFLYKMKKLGIEEKMAGTGG